MSAAGPERLAGIAQSGELEIPGVSPIHAEHIADAG